MNELNRHKKNDKVKWVFTCIAFVLLFVFLAGLCMQLFANDKLKPSNWFKKAEQTEKSISFTSYSLQKSEYAAYGLSDEIESAEIVTAELTPSYGNYDCIIWYHDWADYGDEWLNASYFAVPCVDDYVLVGSDEYGLDETQCMIILNQKFGASIELVCEVTVGNNVLNATRPIECLATPVGVWCIEDYGTCDIYIDSVDDEIIVDEFTYGVGTVKDDLYWYDIYYNLSSEMITVLRDDYGYDWLNETSCFGMTVVCPADYNNEYNKVGNNVFYSNDDLTFQFKFTASGLLLHFDLDETAEIQFWKDFISAYKQLETEIGYFSAFICNVAGCNVPRSSSNKFTFYVSADIYINDIENFLGEIVPNVTGVNIGDEPIILSNSIG